MKSVFINEWQQYGDFSVFSGIVSEYDLIINLNHTDFVIAAWGSDKHIFIFCEALKKKDIKFQTGENLTMF